jgi:DNA-binding transcriptional regulator YiaG
MISSVVETALAQHEPPKFVQLCCNCKKPGVIGGKRIKGRTLSLCQNCLDLLTEQANKERIAYTKQYDVLRYRGSQTTYRALRVKQVMEILDGPVLSMNDVARRLGVNSGTVSKWFKNWPELQGMKSRLYANDPVIALPASRSSIIQEKGAQV